MALWGWGGVDRVVALWVVRCGGGMKGKVCGGTVRGKGVGVAAAWERMGGRRVEERGVLFLSRVCVCVWRSHGWPCGGGEE